MKYANIREEALKNKVACDFFSKFDCTDMIKEIDFAVKLADPAPLLQRRGRGGNGWDLEGIYLFWAEAKKGRYDILAMLAQLVLTIGKARIFDRLLPPPFLGCFDSEKIAFVPYADIQDILYAEDVGRTVAKISIRCFGNGLAGRILCLGLRCRNGQPARRTDQQIQNMGFHIGQGRCGRHERPHTKRR